MAEWRYLAQRVLTGEWLHMDVPLVREDLGWALSGAGSLKGTVSPDAGQLRAPDGKLMLEEWGTFLYAQVDGAILWGGIVVTSHFTGDQWAVEAAGFTTYPHGLVFDGSYIGFQVDAADCFRAIWDNIQAHPDGNLAVFIPNDMTGTRLGVGELVQLADGSKYDASYFDLNNLPDGAQDVPAAPYELEWYNTPDCGTELENLAKQVPFDYTESHHWLPTEAVYPETLDPDLLAWLRGHSWATDSYGRLTPPAKPTGSVLYGDITQPEWDRLVAAGWWSDPGDGVARLYPPAGYPQVAHTVRVHWPRAGRQRTDLAFVQGDNVTQVVTPTINGDDYANEIIGLGAGSGQAAVRSTVSVRDGRLRRTSVHTVKGCTDETRLTALVRADLARRVNALEVTAVTVADHANAPIGSWQVGDDILVRANIPWLGDVALWCRITAWALAGDDTATLALARSDSFQYGTLPTDSGITTGPPPTPPPPAPAEAPVADPTPDPVPAPPPAPAPSPNPAPAPAPITRTTTFTATWTATWRGPGGSLPAGSRRGDTTDVVEGLDPSGHNGNEAGAVGFPNLTGTLTGATVQKVEIYLYPNHWYYAAGGSVVMNVHGASTTTKPALMPAKVGARLDWVTPGWVAGTGRWVTVPTDWCWLFQAGTATGITLGPGPSGSGIYYGRFNGAGTPNQPQLRVTYTK